MHGTITEDECTVLEINNLERKISQRTENQETEKQKTIK